MGTTYPERATVLVLERRKRKGPILTPSSLPCLGDTPTVNITQGCAHGCSYCYTQGYSQYPGRDRVVLFDNTPPLVRDELERKRRRPRRVYFSPSSDPFQPVAEVQDITYRTMSVLLERGVEVAFLTKGWLDERFLALFASRPAAVFAQVGITTLAERFRQALELQAASTSQRLGTIEHLTGLGVATRARLDPLIPDLTDTEENLAPLLGELSRRGVRHAAASYLFLRPAFAGRVGEQLRGLAGSPYSTGGWPWCRFADGVAGGRMIGLQERRERFARLAALAANHGIEVRPCACKNPDLDLACDCEIAGPAPRSARPAGLPLFAGLGDGPVVASAGQRRGRGP